MTFEKNFEDIKKQANSKIEEDFSEDQNFLLWKTFLDKNLNDFWEVMEEE
ncbi:MAG: hypothetical protein V5A68_00225 [Candidatus Thermoplasmatota archaeon]